MKYGCAGVFSKLLTGEICNSDFTEKKQEDVAGIKLIVNKYCMETAKGFQSTAENHTNTSCVPREQLYNHSF